MTNNATHRIEANDVSDRSVVRRWSLVGSILVVAVYASSMYLPAIKSPVLVNGKGQETLSGREVLVQVMQRSWDDPHLSSVGFARIVALGWMPNVLTWCGLVLAFLGRWRLAATAGLAAMLLASLWMTGITYGFWTWTSKYYLVGYYCWLWSMGLLAAFSSLMAMVTNPRRFGSDLASR